MDLVLELALLPLLLPDWLDPEYIITALGNWALWGVALIVFAECGLFSLLPGDSLLFTVGMFVALGTITFGDLSSTAVLVVACLILTVAAVLGNVVGYWIGALIGPPIFKPREGFWGRVFDPKWVDITHELLERYGNRALILARFVPFARTFITLIAGIGRMPFRRFITYTAIGGVLWASGVTVLGYFLGQIPVVHQNVELAFILIVAVSLIPMVVEYFLAKRRGPADESGGVALDNADT